MTGEYLEIGLAAQERYSEVFGSGSFVGVVESENGENVACGGEGAKAEE